MPFNGQIPVGAMVEYHPIFATHRDYVNLVQKFCHVYSLDLYYTRGESGKETLWSRTKKNWRK